MIFTTSGVEMMFPFPICQETIENQFDFARNRAPIY